MCLSDTNTHKETMKGVERDVSAVPESVMDAVNQTLANVEEVQARLHEFLSLSDPEVLTQMPPLQRAQSLFLLAKITSTLYTLKLRCSGVHPDDHPVKSELDRLSLYEDKLNRIEDLSKEQRQNMRSLSRGEGSTMNNQERSGQKRKYQSSEKQSVQAAAKEFLEKAAREILGNNASGIKGPIPADISDDDNQ